MIQHIAVRKQLESVLSGVNNPINDRKVWTDQKQAVNEARWVV